VDVPLLVNLSCAVLAAVAPIAAFALTASEPAPGSALGRYFAIRGWESWRRHAVHRVLGVVLYKRLLLFWYDNVFGWAYRALGTGLLGQPPLTREAWRRVNGQHLRPCAPRREELAEARHRTMRFELTHAFLCLPVLPIVAGLLTSGRHAAAGVVAGVLAVTNVYPLLMQRYNRSRIQAALRGLASRRCRVTGTARAGP
jgi:hypothetical protein